MGGCNFSKFSVEMCVLAVAVLSIHVALRAVSHSEKADIAHRRHQSRAVRNALKTIYLWFHHLDV